MKPITFFRIIINYLYLIFLVFVIRFTFGFNDTKNNFYLLIFDNQNNIYWGLLVFLIVFNYFIEKYIEKRNNYRISNILLLSNLLIIFLSILINVIWQYQKNN